MASITRALLASAALLAWQAAGQPSPAAPLALGLVSADGILVPFAVFDGATWEAAWGEPEDPIKLDGMIEARPSYWRDRNQRVPQRWHIVARPPATTQAVNVLRSVIFDEHCQQQTGLLTDLRARRANPHEKALATDSRTGVALPIDLSSGALRGGWQDLIDLMNAEIERQEAAAPRARGARQPLTVRVFADGIAGARTLYYEAERSYGTGSAFIANGWVHAMSGAKPVVLHATALLDDAEGRPIVTRQPLGILRVGATAYWITQNHGYESEAVSVMRADRDGITEVFTRNIGGC